MNARRSPAIRPATAWILLGIYLWSGALAGAEPPDPGLVLDAGRVLLAPPPDVLELAEVQEHLNTGLTTSFVFEVSLRGAPGGRRTGTGIVEIRWDPWEESYSVRARGSRGRPETTKADDLDELVGWWRGSRLPLADGLQSAAASSGRDAPRGRLRLTIVPFSSREASDTRQWFADTLSGRTGSAAERAAEAAEKNPDPLRGVLGTLLATSISRRSVLEYEWTVQVTVPKVDAAGPGDDP